MVTSSEQVLTLSWCPFATQGHAPNAFLIPNLAYNVPYNMKENKHHLTPSSVLKTCLWEHFYCCIYLLIGYDVTGLLNTFQHIPCAQIKVQEDSDLLRQITDIIMYNLFYYSITWSVTQECYLTFFVFSTGTHQRGLQIPRLKFTHKVITKWKWLSRPMCFLIETFAFLLGGFYLHLCWFLATK